MKTQRGQSVYALWASYSKLLGAFLRDQKTGIEYPLTRIRLTELAALEDKNRDLGNILARPAYLAEVDGYKTIELWPVPDATYKIIIRYFPPEQEQ